MKFTAYSVFLDTIDHAHSINDTQVFAAIVCITARASDHEYNELFDIRYHPFKDLNMTDCFSFIYSVISGTHHVQSRFRPSCDVTAVFEDDAPRSHIWIDRLFLNALVYFKKREITGLKLPTAASKRARTTASTTKSGAGADDAANDTESKPAKKPAKSSAKAAPPSDLLQIHLDGEDDDNVPIYDTCADVRRKISAHLREPGVTQAQFCRDLFSQLHGPLRGNSIQSGQLQRFRAMSGANQGGDNKIFHAAYVFFEKKRVAENKNKSKKRQEMEEIWPGGVDRKYFGRTSILCVSDERPTFDEYGKLHKVMVGPAPRRKR